MSTILIAQLLYLAQVLFSSLKPKSFLFQSFVSAQESASSSLLSENYRNPMPRFIGDEPLSAYLLRFCNSAAKDGGRTELILVERLQTLSPQFNNSQKSISSYEKAETLRHKINCNFVHYADVSLANVATELATNRHFRLKKLQLIFNLRSLRFDNFDLFNETLVALSQLYYHCPDCLPFVATFDLPDWKLHRWAATSLHYVTDYFQAVLLPRTSKGYKGLPKGVVHLNPILHGCHLKSKHLYLPTSSDDFAALSTPVTRCNFHQTVLNVSVNSDFPYCLFSTDPVTGEVTSTDYSIDIELLKVMMVRYNFSVRYIDAHNSWGAIENGKWVGVIGHILNGTSNMAICEVGRTRERLEVVDFTTYTLLDQVVFMSQSPTRQQTDLFFSEQMSAGVKLCQLASYLLILAMLMVIFKVHRKLRLRNGKSKCCGISVKALKCQQRDQPTKLLAAFFKQPVDSLITSEPLSIRILYAVYLFASLILSNAYSSLFYSAITVPQYHRPIDTVADLISATGADKVQLAFKDEAAIQVAIYSAQPGRRFYYHLLQHCLRRPPIMYGNQKDMISLVEKNKRLVLIALRMNLLSRRYLLAKVPLHISSEPIEYFFIGWALRRRSSLREPFNLVIKQHRESGLIDQLLQNTIRKAALRRSTRGIRANLFGNDAANGGHAPQTTFDPLQLSELNEVFVLYALTLTAIFTGPFLLGEVLRVTLRRRLQSRTMKVGWKKVLPK